VSNVFFVLEYRDVYVYFEIANPSSQGLNDKLLGFAPGDKSFLLCNQSRDGFGSALSLLR